MNHVVHLLSSCRLYDMCIPRNPFYRLDLHCKGIGYAYAQNLFSYLVSF